MYIKKILAVIFSKNKAVLLHAMQMLRGRGSIAPAHS
jgi:hypothetical protein